MVKLIKKNYKLLWTSRDLKDQNHKTKTKKIQIKIQRKIQRKMNWNNPGIKIQNIIKDYKEVVTSRDREGSKKNDHLVI